MSCNIVISGVGGQGTLLASRLLAESAIKENLPVKIGETYGMAQRGGPVMGVVQIGGESMNPRIRKGEADALLAFEISEGVRTGVVYLKDDGLALVNSRIISPAEVLSGIQSYPKEKDLMNLLKKVTKSILLFDATALAEKAGDPIATNLVMVGALSASEILPFNEETILGVLKEIINPQYYDLNLAAFELGKEAYNTISKKMKD